jgi:hypothetical protein
MNTRNLPGGKGRPELKADILAANCESIDWNMWKPRFLTTLWASAASYGDGFTYLWRHLILQSYLEEEGSRLFRDILKIGAESSSEKLVTINQTALRHMLTSVGSSDR